MADLHISLLRRVFVWAIDEGVMTHNPLAKTKRFHKGNTRADIVWTQADIDKATMRFPARILDAIMLALWTGQRQQDLLALRWSDIDGDFIRLKQRKTGVDVSIFVVATLRDIIHDIPAVDPFVLTNTPGRPWTESGFQTSFDKARAKAQMEGLNFHDLRGTAENRLRESGCIEAEVHSITGREMTGSASAYFKRSDALSRVAMQNLEAQFGNIDCKNLVKMPYNSRQKG